MITHQGPIAEVTVVQKLNQGTSPKTGCYRFRLPFFDTFLGKQKSKVVMKHPNIMLKHLFKRSLSDCVIQSGMNFKNVLPYTDT